MVTLKIREVAPSAMWNASGRAWCTCGAITGTASEQAAALWATMHIARAH